MSWLTSLWRHNRRTRRLIERLARRWLFAGLAAEIGRQARRHLREADVDPMVADAIAATVVARIENEGIDPGLRDVIERRMRSLGLSPLAASVLTDEVMTIAEEGRAA